MRIMPDEGWMDYDPKEFHEGFIIEIRVKESEKIIEAEVIDNKLSFYNIHEANYIFSHSRRNLNRLEFRNTKKVVPDYDTKKVSF